MTLLARLLSAVASPVAAVAGVRGRAVGGSGAPAFGWRGRGARRVALLLTGLGVLLALAPGVAQAHYVQVGSFGSGQVGIPVGVAVDQSSRDVYVADLQYIGNFKYDSSGNELSPPSPFGSGNFSGAAVNPVNGDVYVLNAGGQAIDTFDPSSGALLSSFPVTPSHNLFGYYNAAQIATDAAGNVYVPNAANSDVEEYDSAGNLIATFTGSGSTALSGPTGVAVDGAGNVWVADDGNNRVEEFDPTGATVLSTISSPGVQDVALDSAGNVFSSVVDGSGAHVIEYDSTGSQIDDFGLGTIGQSPYGAVESVAVDDTSGVVYVADSSNNVVWVFSPPAPPIVSGESFSNVGTTYATLSAHVNPLGLDTTYHFEYGTSTAYGSSDPVPNADTGSGTTPQSVSQNVPRLQPATTYHYRLVATNSKGSTAGPDQSFTTYQTMPAQNCPNAQFRTGDSANLPDCRAYESVTPADIQDGATIHSVYGWPDGRHVYYLSVTPLSSTATNGNNEAELATRTANGWQTTAISPPQGPGTPAGQTLNLTAPIAFTSDLSTAFINNPFDDDPLDQDNGGFDAYRVDVATGAVSLASRPDSGPMTAAMLGPAHNDVVPPGAWLDGASADGSRVLFEVNGQVPVAAGTTQDTRTPGLAAGDEIYERYDGHTYLVGILPGGSVPACGASIANQLTNSFGDNPTFSYQALAPDGSNVVFNANDCSAGGMYLRDLVHGTTVQLPGTGYGGRTADGTKIFILSDQSNGDLAEYDIASGQLTEIGSGQLLASSDDGSRVYYLGTDNALHLWDNGATTTIPGTDAGGYAGGTVVNNGNLVSVPNVPVASPDGSSFEFIDRARLTAYDNGGHREAYLYRAASNSVICLSCNPSGAPPTSDSTQTQDDAQLLDLERPQFDPFLPDVAPFVSGDGTRAVFETTEALLPQDRNVDTPGASGAMSGMDVYEWEADGTGSCNQSSVSGGCLYLLSSGAAGSSSFLAGASANLNDVYILTSDQLLPGMDGAMHVYDARVGGGFAAPSGPVPCSGDACQGAVAESPPLPAAASVTFTGPGDATPAISAGRVRVLHKTLRGTRFVLTVSVPGRGRITIAGAGVKTVHKSVSRAATYRLTVSLTAHARKALRHRHKLRVTFHITYLPTGGAPSTVRGTVMLIAPRRGSR